MIKFQKTGQILVLILIVSGLFSCKKDDNAAPFEVIGDVFVIKKFIDEEVKFANSYVAWGNQPMKTAKVATPQGAEFQLTATDAIKNTWAKEPTSNDYSSSTPIEANYQFLVIHEDISHQAVDILKFDDINFTTITSAEVEVEVLSVQWESNSDADAYVVRLMNTSGEIAFLSQTLPKELGRLDIGPNIASGAWQETPEIGANYTVELMAFRFEPDADAQNLSYHIQEISVSQQVITWE